MSGNKWPCAAVRNPGVCARLGCEYWEVQWPQMTETPLIAYMPSIRLGAEVLIPWFSCYFQNCTIHLIVVICHALSFYYTGDSNWILFLGECRKSHSWRSNPQVLDSGDSNCFSHLFIWTNAICLSIVLQNFDLLFVLNCFIHIFYFFIAEFVK